MTKDGLTASGAGEASNPTFSTAELNELLAASRDRDLAEEPARRIKAHETKVEKARAFLESAEAALAAERKAQKGSN
jgi:hypothetical protein